MKIILVEDDEELACELISALKKEGDSVDHADCGEEAKAKLNAEQYDLLILDWELPDTTGIEICKNYRKNGGVAPVIMLTGKGKISDRETGLDSGADDYLSKPFSMQELKARLRALKRRADRPLTDNILSIGDLSLDCSRYYVSKAGKTINLVPKEFALLEFLMRNPDHVFSPDNLISHVWTADEEVGPDTLRTHIMNIRKKIDKSNLESFIETVHGIGYRLKKVSHEQ